MSYIRSYAQAQALNTSSELLKEFLEVLTTQQMFIHIQYITHKFCPIHQTNTDFWLPLFFLMSRLQITDEL